MFLMSHMLNNFKDIANNQHVYNRKTTTPRLHTSDTFTVTQCPQKRITSVIA